ncbi:hypothetical protein [Paenibacillus ihuae]|uniref:hypothetical protein n=1 Tax=Paenibacillus ihuae TaxID=1232431 RepID=UPI0006D5631D|nr:hypothetical protein [Paenibacillus ihuae]
MADVEQMDLFVYLQEKENQAASISASIPAPVMIPHHKVCFRFLKRLGATLAWFWIITHNLFGLACWVNVYTVTRGFGGTEAGGWYYLKYECVKSRQVGFWEAEILRIQWLQQYTLSHTWGNLRAKTGGQEVVVRIEPRRAASRINLPPRYTEYADQAIPYVIIQGSH